MGFSIEDQILMENLYVFKGYGAKNLLRNFRVKVGIGETEQSFEKGAKNWHDSKTKRPR